MTTSASMPLQPGQTLFQDKYRIDAQLYAGVYATVYRTARTLMQPVRMLRVVRREPSDTGTAVFNEYLRRFHTELRLAEVIHHPNIVQVFGVDKDADTLALVMEYPPGGNLEDRLRQLAQNGKLMPIADCVRIIQEVSDGLAAVHAEQIVHRNIKPGKVLFDADGHAKLADLGLAQLPGESITRLRIRQTQHPHPGTPAYMSPEQLTVSDYISPASDVYTLGLVLFEMLTGHVFRNVRPGLSASRLRAEIPPWLDKLLASMLENDPRQRPWDASEVSKVLREHTMPNEPVVKPDFAITGDQPLAGAAAIPAAMKQPAPAQNQPAPVTPQRDERARPGPSFDTTEDGPLSNGGKRHAPGRLKVVLAVVAVIVLCCGLGFGAGALLTNIGPDFQPYMVLTSIADAADRIAHTPEPTRPHLQVTASPTIVEPTDVPLAVDARVPTDTLAAIQVITPMQGLTFTFVRIPAGSFLMGSNDSDVLAEANEKPQQTISLTEFSISRYAVTNAQFNIFVKTTGYTPTAWLENRAADKPNHPATSISWNDANAFCLWLSKLTGRKIGLPSEAQWEKAARGAGGWQYPWGNNAPSSTLLNFDMRVKDTSPVGSYSPRGDSPYGLADMAGNVWEWTTTLYFDEHGEPYAYPYVPTDGREDTPINGPAYHVLRGGSYLNDSRYVRSAFRGVDESAQAQKGYGFRIVVLP
ncbi:MAG TPA: bifunctional serine/threonine-protein kinase/formylglycine-generating enzyme family protein [Anaerolineae bacterium]|jgi:formylglycine-generating enzyme required for sulfatase activity/serine/threonine protein kinase